MSPVPSATAAVETEVWAPAAEVNHRAAAKAAAEAAAKPSPATLAAAAAAEPGQGAPSGVGVGAAEMAPLKFPKLCYIFIQFKKLHSIVTWALASIIRTRHRHNDKNNVLFSAIFT